MAVGGSTCGAKLGGSKLGGAKLGGAKKYAKRGGDTNMPPANPGSMITMGELSGPGYVPSVIGGAKKRVMKRVIKRVKRGGNSDMSESPEMPQISEMPQVQEMPVVGGKKLAKRGGNPEYMPKALGGAKKRVLTPYNKFVKKHFPLMKVKYPNYKAPEIMKKIADEWKKTK
jgi:hypothetical protein